MAIQGAGFFQITLPTGLTGYTRAGALHRDSQGLVVTAEGFLDDFGEQRVLIREVVVDKALANTRFGGDVADAGRAEAVGGKHLSSRGQDGLASSVFDELVGGGTACILVE